MPTTTYWHVCVLAFKISPNTPISYQNSSSGNVLFPVKVIVSHIKVISRTNMDFRAH